MPWKIIIESGGNKFVDYSETEPGEMYAGFCFKNMKDMARMVSAGHKVLMLEIDTIPDQGVIEHIEQTDGKIKKLILDDLKSNGPIAQKIRNLLLCELRAS